MPSYVHNGDYQTVNHYHHSYHDREHSPSHHHQGPTIPSSSATYSRRIRIVTPSNISTPSDKSSRYKVRTHSPHHYRDDIYSWANSDMPWWFTDRTRRNGSSRSAAAAHESMLHDLRIKELEAAKESALHKLQCAHMRYEHYEDQWRQAVMEGRDWDVAEKPHWTRGSSDTDDYGGITVERRRGRLAMVKRKKRSAEKDGRRGRAKGRFGFIDI